MRLKEEINGKDVYVAIRDLCIERNYKCKGCPYSIKKILGDSAGKMRCCIFDICPCNWDNDRR